jgi:uncharacterized Zn finger protein
MRRDLPDRFFPPSRPREAKGGIRSQTRRGDFGESWWARRWISVLEGFEIGARLHRGRNYARRGQVLSIAISEGRVEAQVQGSRPDPYHVRIGVKTLAASEWRRLAAALAREARFAAKLLAGAMPEEIEEAFRAAGLSLFPDRHADLRTECSCPDWSNPCKHVAAVYYLLGEEFDRDPFLIFRLRGMERTDLVRLLAPPAARAAPTVGREPEAAPPARAAKEPLPAEARAFWRGAELAAHWLGETTAPETDAALVRRLGPFPFWRGRERPIDTLVPVYAAASAMGLAILAGEPSGPGPSSAAPSS